MKPNEKASKPEPLIDFTELVSNVMGEGLEQLTRSLGERNNLAVVWTGRGADSGRDMFFTEIKQGPLSQSKTKWLVSCKDKAKSGESVKENDLPPSGIQDKLSQHSANGFLLVTTTTISTAAKALLDSLDRGIQNIHTLVWDSADLSRMLLDPRNEDLLKQYLPKSYKKVKGLTSLEGSLLAFKDQLPDDVLLELMRLVKPYSGTSLKGLVIWPYDKNSAYIIDQIVAQLLIAQDTDSAITATENIEYDAFVALINVLQTSYPDECRNYLFGLVSTHNDPDIRFNAAQAIFANYEIHSSETIDIAIRLGESALQELYSGEIADYLHGELCCYSESYQLSNTLLSIAYHAEIVSISIGTLIISIDAKERRVTFNGEFECHALFSFDREEVGVSSFPGIYSGYFDDFGMYIEEADIDVAPFYE